MANFCTKCGSPLDSNAVFCPNCGAEIKNNSNPNTPKNNALLKVVFLIAGIIVLALIFSSIFGRGYRSVLDDLFEGIEDAEPDKIVRIMPDCEIEYLEKSLNEYDVYDSIEDYINASLGMMIKSLNMESYVPTAHRFSAENASLFGIFRHIGNSSKMV